MIKIKNLNKKKPYRLFKDYLKKAIASNQPTVDAICISSFNKNKNEVSSRFVNLKYIYDEEWIFFSNYESNKADDFNTHDQISAIFYWNQTDVQIRIKANIFKTHSELSDEHFFSRSPKKNAIALSSQQSRLISSYEKVLNNFKNKLDDKNSLSVRPDNWGGYSFKPYYFEFWEGNEYRINKRQVFVKEGNSWKAYFLQP